MSTILWRITRQEYADSALSGLGGLYASGRWHHQGQHIVYLASTWSLAVLEVFVHLGRHDAKIPLVYLGVEVTDNCAIERLQRDQLPDVWSRQPPGPVTQMIGMQWLKDEKSLFLEVPSSLSPVESNWLFNPRHPEAKQVKVIYPPTVFCLDVRLWKS